MNSQDESSACLVALVILIFRSLGNSLMFRSRRSEKSACLISYALAGAIVLSALGCQPGGGRTNVSDVRKGLESAAAHEESARDTSSREVAATHADKLQSPKSVTTSNSPPTVFYGSLKPTRFDVVYIVPRAGDAALVMGAASNHLVALASALHRLSQFARVGFVFYGSGARDTAVLEPTDSLEKQKAFLRSITTERVTAPDANILGALRTAMKKTKWRKGVKRIVLLVADGPPLRGGELSEAFALAHQFRSDGGILNTMDVARAVRDVQQMLGRATESAASIQKINQSLKMISLAGGGHYSELDPPKSREVSDRDDTG